MINNKSYIKKKKLLDLSFIIPTFNSEKYIKKCISSIIRTVEKKINFEILIVDGGSTDQTIQIVEKLHLNIKIFSNPLVTGEAGKLIGIQKAKGKFLCLLDSDNYLEKKYINLSLKYLKLYKNSIGAEPYKFSYSKRDGIIDRYCALMGVNDPINLYLKNFDKYSVLYRDWNQAGIKLKKENKDHFFFSLNKNNRIVPTIGANGSIFRSNILKNFIKNKKYFFDVDFIIHELKRLNEIDFIKIKCGIRHLYCNSSYTKFYSKQKRRIQDFFYHQEKERLNLKKNLLNFVEFIFDTLIVFRQLYKSIKLYFLYKDKCLLIHWLLCFLTLYIYSLTTIKMIFFNKSQFKR